jgi:DNA-binding response OmpR family regulator
MRIAHLDSDSGFLLVTSKRVERLGWEHRTLPKAASPEQIVALAIDAVVVDLAIVGSRCWAWLERLRELDENLCIVVCSGSASTAQRVRALRLGADDWLSKPCHPEELIARIEGILRARRQAARERDVTPIEVGEIEIRRDQYQAFVLGCSLNLTRREFQLLELLARNDGCILERDGIYESLWGYAMVTGDRSVDVFVRKVRHKLELASPHWSYIHTHFGVGYSFAAKPIESFDSDRDDDWQVQPEPIAA